MSTYYSFKCDKCKLLGGFMSRQAWGTGNADLIDNFKFVMHHSLNCGTEFQGVVSEHQQEYEDYEDTNIASEARKRHLAATEDIFPHSSDWEFMRENENTKIPELKKLWTENETKLLENRN